MDFDNFNDVVNRKICKLLFNRISVYTEYLFLITTSKIKDVGSHGDCRVATEEKIGAFNYKITVYLVRWRS